MNSKFPVLTSISVLLRVVGWIGVAAALIYVLYYLVLEPNQEGHMYGADSFMHAAGGFAAAIANLMVVALGELILVGLAIEKNTRKEEKTSSPTTPSSNS